MSLIIELQKEKEQLLKRIEAIDLLMSQYSVNTSESVKELPKRKDGTSINDLQKASTPQKLLLTLKEHQRFMKIREIAKYLFSKLGGNEDDWVKKLSRTTGKLKQAGKITIYQVGKSRKNVFWGSPNWLENNGNIISKYKYNESSVDKSQTSLLIDL